MENLDQVIKKNGVINGLLFGAIFFVIAIFNFYYITTMTDSALAMLFVPLLIIIVAAIGGAILFCFDLRNKIGGFWNLKQATSGIFIMFFVSYLVASAGGFLFGKFIEPQMVDKLETRVVGATTEMLQKQNFSQEKIDQKVAETEKNFEDKKNVTIGKTAKDFGIAVIIYFVIALVFGSLFKKEKPLYDLPTEDVTPEVIE